jgi:hypothetical protein
LIPGEKELWWTNFAKMVDYIALKKPVLSMVPDPSEARAELARARLGVFLDGNTEQKAKRLTRFLMNGPSGSSADDSVCREYLASNQAKKFAETFEEVCGCER